MAVSCKRAAGMLVRITMLLMPAATVLAQKGDTYSLAALVDSASRHLPLLLQKQAMVHSAEAGITEAKHAYLPKVNLVEELSLGTANDLTGAYMPFQGMVHNVSGGITADNNYQATTGNVASIYAEYELVNFGLRGARVANARAYAGVQRADLARELYTMKWQIARLWLEISRLRYQLAVDEEDIRRYESMYTITAALTSTGINAGVDSSLAKAGLSRTKVGYNQAAGKLRVLMQQMTYYTGIEHPEIALDTSWRMTGMNGTVTGVPGMAGGMKGSGGGAGTVSGMHGKDEAGKPGQVGMNGTGVSGMAGGAVEVYGGGAGAETGAGAGAVMGGNGTDTGMTINPLADYYSKQRLQYKSEEDLIRKSYLPKVMLGAGGWARGSGIQYNNAYKSLGEGLGYQRLNYMAGLGITYDLFNGVRKKDRLAVAGHQAEAAGFALAQQELSLRNAALQADEAMRTAQINLQELPVQLQAARDAYQQKLAQYRAGIINLVDLTNASFLLYQAQSDLIETQNSWYMAGLDKAAATGSLDQFMQTLK